MTTGNRNFDQRYWVDTPSGPLKVGKVRYAQWNGEDAISSSTPRPTYEKVTRSPVRLTNLERDRLMALRNTNRESYIQALEKWRASRREAKRKKLLLPPKAYTKVVSDIVSAAWKVKQGVYQPYVTNSMTDPFGGQLPNVDVGKEYKLIAKVREKAYGSGFNPAVFTAEGRQAFDMIGDAARSLAGALNGLKKGDWRRVAKALAVPPKDVKRVFQTKKTASNRWLELQYGWLPLVSDMEEGAKYIAEAVNGTKSGRNKIVARKTWSETEDATNVADRSSGHFTKRVIIFQLQYIIYGLQKSPVYLPSLQTLATVVWEKTPWSFVADWVIPIGSYLEACRTAADLKGTVVRSLRRDYFTTEVSFGTGAKFLGYHASPFGEPSVHMMKFERTITEEINPPSPVKGMATDLTFLSWRRAANAVALLSQRFGTR